MTRRQLTNVGCFFRANFTGREILKVEKYKATITMTEDNILVVSVENEVLPIKEVEALIKEIDQDTRKCSEDIIRRRYLRQYRQVTQSDSILHRLARKAVAVCL